MSHYVAIVEDAGPDRAVGVWFPDLPGCFSAGDSMDEALVNAPEAIVLYAEALAAARRQLPPARTLDELKQDPQFASETEGNLVAIVPFTMPVVTAAE
ncbi:MAG: type II toxin-antitoxin system HicB family antitoxin [Rhizobiales bacterium]|nr:type II toxin-antitoxin system HicB family antitoxin [Hyphomicrobiales bacterium]